MKYFLSIIVAIILIGLPANATTGFVTTVATTATTTSTKILNINAKRVYLIVQNTGSESILVNTASSATVGVLVPSGGSYEPNLAPINEIWIKSTAATSTIVVIEGQ